MNLAYTMAQGRGDTDLVLFKLAKMLEARGLRCCGTVQINSERADAGPCDMDVRVMPDGPVLRISQDLGRASRGCRLDPGALETAVALVSASLEQDADVLIVNKFGKHEAEGRGFRAVIAEALSKGIPVLVGVNALNLPAFEEFSESLGRRLPCEITALADWVTGIGRSCVFVICHGIFPPSAIRARPKEGTDDEANDTNRRADHWDPAGVRGGCASQGPSRAVGTAGVRDCRGGQADHP